MQKYEQVAMTNKKQIFINNLIGGIAWGFGATVGVAILLSILGFLLSPSYNIPVIKDVLSSFTSVTKQVTQDR